MGTTAHPVTTPMAARSPGDQRRLAGGAVAGILGMLAWIVGLSMVPTTAHLSDGAGAVADMIRDAVDRLFVAGVLGAVGAVLLPVLLIVLVATVPGAAPGGGALRIGMITGVLTGALVCTGVMFGGVATFSARAGAGAELIAAGWSGLFLGFTLAAVPSVVMALGVTLGAHLARLAPTWVTALGLLCAVAHVPAAGAFARTGPFAPDGIIGTLAPLTAAVWIIALSVVLLIQAFRTK